MKKAFKIVIILIGAVFIILQFFQIDKTNPVIVEAETLEAAVTVPADIQQILGRSCNDCHTHKSLYPWYSYIQPSGWFLRDHIDDGRKHLNLSRFATYEPKKRMEKLEEICEEINEAKMPLPSYLWIHRDAVLSESDRKALCDWTKQASSALGGEREVRSESEDDK
ncbi:MAG: heme-binding domain-containing protein [Pyrinomonadaceae bacterium]